MSADVQQLIYQPSSQPPRDSQAAPPFPQASTPGGSAAFPRLPPGAAGSPRSSTAPPCQLMQLRVPSLLRRIVGHKCNGWIVVNNYENSNLRFKRLLLDVNKIQSLQLDINPIQSDVATPVWVQSTTTMMVINDMSILKWLDFGQ